MPKSYQKAIDSKRDRESERHNHTLAGNYSVVAGVQRRLMRPMLYNHETECAVIALMYTLLSNEELIHCIYSHRDTGNKQGDMLVREVRMLHDNIYNGRQADTLKIYPLITGAKDRFGQAQNVEKIYDALVADLHGAGIKVADLYTICTESEYEQDANGQYKKVSAQCETSFAEKCVLTKDTDVQTLLNERQQRTHVDTTHNVAYRHRLMRTVHFVELPKYLHIYFSHHQHTTECKVKRQLGVQDQISIQLTYNRTLLL